MKCIRTTQTEVFFNLAAEEYLLKHQDEEACMIWQSDPAIVVGKHQNALAEIDYRFARKHGVAVARRLTGGGTVYHDRGNLNFTLIRKGERGKMIDFDRHISVITDFLRKRGIRAEKGPKHEILVGNLKISGNAEHVYRDRVLHHGTLLFNADLAALSAAIRHEGGVYSDKSVPSNPATVVNLSELDWPDTGMEPFISDLYGHLLDYFSGNEFRLKDDEVEEIRELVRKKYDTWEWIYGWSPDYTFSNRIDVGGIQAFVRFNTHRGIIRDFVLETDALTSAEKKWLSGAFDHIPHRYEEVSATLKSGGLASRVPADAWDDLVYGLF